LILTFPAGTKRNLVQDHEKTIRDILSLPETAELSYNGKWCKLVANGVRKMVIHGTPIATPEMLEEALRRNPILKDIKFTQRPDWVRRPADLVDSNSSCSSCSFAFEDPDGKLGQRILKEQLFMFGAPVRLRRWEEKPRLQQCTKCWGLDHPTRSCRKQYRCRLCGGNHSEDKHRQRCECCKNKTAEEPCATVKCANCGDGHYADSVNCPSKRKYSIPARDSSPPNTQDAMTQ
jgi:hypothetical protein